MLEGTEMFSVDNGFVMQVTVTTKVVKTQNECTNCNLT